ncbi:hypothetical protein [Micromonospora sp. AKA38]|uniref:hypothetical protein n=1 Tax=Micromonospora sp. AKA38 TaxID=2733861 RepID=UPI0024917E4F|nr:hypothetical protein [Micromonospora sp. AKA38]
MPSRSTSTVMAVCRVPGTSLLKASQRSRHGSDRHATTVADHPHDRCGSHGPLVGYQSIAYGSSIYLQTSTARDEMVNTWLQAGMAVVVGLMTAAGALIGVRLSVHGSDRATEQRELAGRREEWWRRFTWAAELALDDAPVKRVTGLKLLTKLAQSDLAKRDECLLIDVFQGRVLDELLSDLSGNSEGGHRYDPAA